MRKLFVFTLISAVLVISSSCGIFDHFSAYSGKDLISHLDLNNWSAAFGDPYMDYSETTAAAAGTTGLPDSTALIYRLENKNLMPDGDFEAATPGTLPTGWTETNANVADAVAVVGAPINGQALQFAEIQDEYLTFDISNISDSSIISSNYLLRFDLLGDYTGSYFFRVEDSGYINTYSSTIEDNSILYTFPSAFSTVPLTEFLIRSNTTVFNINFAASQNLQSGYIDNFRIIKSDQDQDISIEIAYYNENRIDGLDLISGWYRFSLYVKADPSAGANNIFDSNAVTLSITALDSEGLASSSESACFSASDYSSFTDWTNIYIDTNLQIIVPDDAETTVIRLAVSPACTTGGSIGLDSGSILVSTPQLFYSSTEEF